MHRDAIGEIGIGKLVRYRRCPAEDRIVVLADESKLLDARAEGAVDEVADIRPRPMDVGEQDFKVDVVTRQQVTKPSNVVLREALAIRTR